MMRPSTAKAMQQKREQRHRDIENDMMISGSEINKQSSKDVPLPRYRSMKMNLNEEASTPISNKNKAKGSGYGQYEPSSARGDSARGTRSALGGRTGSASKRDNYMSGNSNAQTHQPRQKRQSNSRPGTTTQPAKPKFGAGYKNTKTDKRDITGDYSVSGVSMMTGNSNRIQKNTLRNNDICDELVLSNEGMRFDQKVKDAEDQKKLMEEAEAALAETDQVLKTRKDALVAKHIEGRESIHELDYIFKDQKFDLGDDDNYLDQHKQRMEEQKREIEQLREEKKTSHRSGLFEWNLRTNNEFSAEDPSNSREQDVDFVNLNIDRTPSNEKPSQAAVAAVPTRPPVSQIEERKQYIPSSDEDEIATKSPEDMKKERQMMLDMIKQKQKMQFKHADAKFLDGIGDGILDELEISIKETKDQENDLKQEKKVTFAEASARSKQVEISTTERTHQPEPKSNPSSEEGESSNKLAELNNLLKQKDFKFKQEDENEFDDFLKQLQNKRQQISETKPQESERSYQREAPAYEPSPIQSPKPASEQEESMPRSIHSPEQEETEEEKKQAKIKAFDDDMDSILQMKPGNFRENLMVDYSDPSPETKQESPVPPKKTTVVQTNLIKPSPVPQANKVNDFMKFMDNIEEEMSSQYSSSARRPRADIEPASVSSRRMGQKTKDIDSSSFMAALEVEASAPVGGTKMKAKMMELEIERDEQAKALQLMQELRAKERDEHNSIINEARKQGAEYADQVRQEMATRIEKQVQMIEALLEDKRKLQETVEKTTEDARDIEYQAEKQKKVLEDRLHVELKKNREAWLAAEKVRKERWEKDKVQEIRQQTVKGLEPEIQRIVERNKEELRRAEENHQAEIRIKKEEILIEQERKFSQMRERLISEKEQALDAEREKTQQKLHEQYERLESQFNEERLRWKNNVYTEYDRLESMRKRDKDDLEGQIQTIQKRCDKEVESKEGKHQERVAELMRKHQIEIKKMKEVENIAKEEWLESYKVKVNEQRADFQKKIREEMVKERNREIEAIINKLGDETHDTQKQLLQQYERKVNDVEQKWKAEIEEYKVSVNQWKHKFQSESDNRVMLDENLRVLGRRINDLEIEIQDKKDQIENLQNQKTELQQRLSKIEGDQSGLRSELEDEMRFKLESKEKSIRVLKSDLQSLGHQHSLEIEQVKNQNKNDLEMIQEKVQMAMAKKKEIIDALHEETQMKELQVIKLKEMLEKQRRELLMGR